MKKKVITIFIGLFSCMPAWCIDGDTFKYITSNNVELTMKVISEVEQTVQITSASRNFYNSPYQIDFSIPLIANGYTITSIADNAFQSCSWINDLSIPGCIETIGREAFKSCGFLKNVVLEDGVKVIEDYAFSQSSLTSITIPPSMVSIGNYVFSICDKLVEVHVTDLVSWCKISFADTYPHYSNPLWTAKHLYIGDEELVGHITIPDEITKIPNGAFMNLKGMTSLTIPESVIEIDSYAFCGCSNLTVVNMSDNVISIGYGAFADNRNITTFTFPSKLESIGDDAFEFCENLTTLELPCSLKTIGASSFRYCSGLEEAVIGEHVESIGMYAFYGCIGLKDVYCYAKEVPGTENNAFEGSYIENATLHVPVGSIDLYTSTSPWNGFGNIIPIEDFIMGDVNGDGEIDLSDAIMVTYYSLHMAPTNFNKFAADMNGDGVIDLSDAIIIIYMSLGVK